LGYRVTYVPVSAEGQVRVDDVAAAITDDTFLISIMHANNETGAMNPIAEIGALARNHKILFHSDAVQTFGKMPMDVRKLPVDLLSVCAHKIYGPKGVGALYVRKGVQLEPLLHGGHQENSRRAGTENIPAIVGFAEAVRLCQTEMTAENLRIRELRDLLWDGFQQAVPDCRLNGPVSQRLAGHLNIAFPGVEGDALLMGMNARGICASSGSACTTGTAEPSHVLKAMGLSKKLLKSSVRLTLGRFTTEDEIREVIRIIPELVNRLQRLNVQKR
jgi:cysteine desulfurase